MKGQIFVAGAALLVVLLALIASSFTPTPSIPIVSILAPQLDNLAQEYRYTTGLSHDNDHLDDLSEYFRDNVQGFDAIYALILVQPGAYNLTIGNFLRNPTTVVITAQSSSPSTDSTTLDDRSMDEMSFTASGDVQLIINYTIQNTAYAQSINFTTDRNQTIGWFDIGIRADENNLRRSDVWTIEE